MNPVVTPLRRPPYRVVVLILALIVLLLAACGPTHIDPRWASISTVADGGQIILAFGDRLTLVNADDGRPVPLLDAEGEERLDDQGNVRAWEVRGPDNAQTRFYNTPVFTDDETMLATSYDQRLLEIDFPVARTDGESHAFDQHVVVSPVVDGDFVYVGLADHDLVALDSDDLTEVWRVVTGHGVWAPPLIVDDTLYFTSMDHFLYAVNKETGEVLWKTDMQGALTSTPVHVDGHLYVGGFINKVFDVDAETGEILGEVATSGWVWNAPTLAEDTLYVSDMSGMVHALSITDGLTKLWETKVSPMALAPSPLVADDHVVVGSRDMHVYWLNREDGSVQENLTRQVAGEVLANLVLVEANEETGISEPLVIVSTSATNELLVAFTLDEAQKLWAYGR